MFQQNILGFALWHGFVDKVTDAKTDNAKENKHGKRLENGSKYPGFHSPILGQNHEL
jgi:hypothetical protein